MAYKVFVPRQKNDQWERYWKKSNYKQELVLCDSDGLLPIFLKYLNRNQKIVEAGCGLGKWVIYFAKKNFDITGIDNNQYAIKKLKAFNSKIKARLANIQKLPFKNEEIDVYISLGVLEHFEKGPQKALREAYRVLKPGGLAIIEVPHNTLQQIILRNLHKIKITLKAPLRIMVEKLRLRKKHRPILWEFYEYHYSMKELTGFITKSGLKIIEWFFKDDLDPNKSIGLWLDFPKLRKHMEVVDFTLNSVGRRLKWLYNFFHLQGAYSACIVCVAKKPK